MLIRRGLYFDSHAHLNDSDYTEEEIEERIAEIENSDVGAVIDVGFDYKSSELAVEHANRLDWCFAAVGVHPHDASTMSGSMLEDLRKLALSSDKVAAIGEIGLDYYYDKSERSVQREWFRRQIRLANELGMPIIVHSREADRETMDILKEEGAFSDERKAKFGDGMPHVVIHCFSGSAEFGKEYVKLGAFIGIDGPVTYKNNRKTVEVAEVIPLENIMVETDCPYLTPVPHRGKPNRSPYIEYTVRKIAEIRGIEPEEAARVTYENALAFFRI